MKIICTPFTDLFCISPLQVCADEHEPAHTVTEVPEHARGQGGGRDMYLLQHGEQGQLHHRL